MKKDDRRKDIVDFLIGQGENVAVSDVISRIEGSAATIRRDLDFLEKNGIILRTHGFVRYVQPKIVQMAEFSSDRASIAVEAAKLVQDGELILMDTGMTTLALACELSGRRLTMITNSVSIAHLYSTAPSYKDIQLFVTGGFLRERESALVGRDTLEYLKKIRAGKLFLTTTGVRGLEGLTCVTPFQAEVKQALIAAADQVILLLPPEKLDMDALEVFATFDQIDYIITTRPISDARLAEHLKKLRVQVIVAE